MRTTMWKDLPEDVMMDILLRFGVKTLIRLRCVCKSWKTLISHSTFITAHLNRTYMYGKNDAYLQYLNYGSHNSSRQLVWCLMSTQTHEHQLELEIPVPIESMHFPFLVGSVNGLVCISDWHNYGRAISLWNPSIRKSKIVSLSSSIFPFPQHSGYKNYFALGFGFDSRTNDYKIIRIVYCLDVNCEYIANSNPPVEVYSLATDSWRRIQALVPCYGSRRQSEAFFNESLHWVAFRSSARPDYNRTIMSFDIGGEVFGEMMLPTVVPGAGLHLTVLKETLSLCVFCDVSGQCDIWFMREYGVDESWTKQFTVVMRESIERSLGSANNNDVHLVTWSSQLFSYDLGSLELKNLGIRVAHYTSHVFPFVETLTLL